MFSNTGPMRCFYSLLPAIFLPILWHSLPESVHALPVSMLNSMSQFDPLSALISRQWPMERQRIDDDDDDDDRRMPTKTKVDDDDEGSSKTLEEAAQKPSGKFGTLKLCPPGGRAFFEAYELACPMKRRRKKRYTAMFGFGRAAVPELKWRKAMEEEKSKAEEEEEEEEEEPIGSGSEETEEEQEEEEDDEGGGRGRGGAPYRPANISEIMHICCERGCELADFFPHCGPFSALW